MGNIMAVRHLASITLALTATTALAQTPAPNANLTGKWAITIGTPANPEYRSLEAVVAADGKLTGSLGSPGGAVPIETGRVTGNNFSLSATLGTGIKLSYDGTIVRDTIRGTWVYDKYSGHFVGRRGDTPPPAELAPVRAESPTLDAGTRAATLDSLLKEITNLYVDTALAPRVIADIRARARASAYDTISSATAYARAVTQDLRRFDKHFALIPVTSSSNGPEIPATARDNYGIKRLERLDGNVGYIKFDVFSLDVAAATQVFQSALQFVARTDALIIDLRENHGGAGTLGELLLSYLVAKPPHIIVDRFLRVGAKFDSIAVEMPTIPVPELRYAGRPVYVLTSSRTGSAAEWLAYNLQAEKRATIVGEVTAGAAHPVRFVRLNQFFDASIPVGRVRSRLTGGDFEGVGVRPDVATKSENALDSAYAAILRDLSTHAVDQRAKTEIERALAARSERRPQQPLP